MENDAAGCGHIFERLLSHLLLTPEGQSRPAQVLEHGDRAVLLRLAEHEGDRGMSGRALVVFSDVQLVDELVTLVRHLLDRYPGHVEVLVLGSFAVAEQIARAVARPWKKNAIYALDVSPQSSSSAARASVQVIGRPKRRHPLLTQLQHLPAEGLSLPLRIALRDKLASDAKAARREQAEAEDFATRLQSRKPVATAAFLGCIVVMFALCHAFKGLDVVTLAHMGALIGERVAAGQWWRLLSSVMLHGSFVHLLMNSLVLWLLGGNLERLIGASRMICLYGASGAGGAIASTLIHREGGISVGASGALWGVLAAQWALAMRPRGLLPPAVVAQAKRVATTNLALNVAVSFLPHVDFAAHFGGGIVGAALTLSLLPWGLLPSRASRRWSAVFAGGAVLWVSAMVLSCALAIAVGQPWRLDEAPRYETRVLPGLDASAQLPTNLEAHAASQSDDVMASATLRIGEAYEPGVLEIARIDRPNPASADQLEHELNVAKASLAESIDEAKATGEPQQGRGTGPALFVLRSYAVATAGTLTRGVVVTPNHIWRLESFVREDYPTYNDVSWRFAESLRETYTSNNR